MGVGVVSICATVFRGCSILSTRAKSGELDTVDSKDFKPIVDACTLCDLCFMTKCPYVPPHEFNLDFSPFMLRYRAVEAKRDGVSFADRQIARTDTNGALGARMSGLANWAIDIGNKATRSLLSRLFGVNPRAALPKFAEKTLEFVA